MCDLPGNAVKHRFNPWYMMTTQRISRIRICVCSDTMPAIFIGKFTMEVRFFGKICDYLIIFTVFGIILNGTILGS